MRTTQATFDPVVLRSDPQALMAAWAGLLQKHEHLHQPQAAAMLDVPEACLVAAQLGKAATRLEGDPAEILSAISGFGKLLIAVPHHAGVLIGIARPVRFSLDGKRFVLTDGFTTLSVAADSIDQMYTVIEHDGMHGRERHLQVFDAHGDGLFKLLVLYKRNEADLIRLSEKYRAKEQPTILNLTPKSRIQVTDMQVERSHSEATVVTLDAMSQILKNHCASGGVLALESRQSSVTLSVEADAPKMYGVEDNMLHMSHALMKFHSHGRRLGALEVQHEGFVCRSGSSELWFRTISRKGIE